MIDFELLNRKIRDSGMTIVAISSKSGILRETLYNRLNGSTDFKASEILRISDVLRLSKFEQYRIIQDRLYQSDFDRLMAETDSEKE